MIGHPCAASTGWGMLDTGASHHIQDGDKDEDYSRFPRVSVKLAVGHAEAYQVSEDLLIFPFTEDLEEKVGTIFSVDRLARSNFRFCWDQDGPTLTDPTGFVYPVYQIANTPWLTPDDTARLDMTLKILTNDEERPKKMQKMMVNVMPNLNKPFVLHLCPATEAQL